VVCSSRCSSTAARDRLALLWCGIFVQSCPCAEDTCESELYTTCNCPNHILLSNTSTVLRYCNKLDEVIDTVLANDELIESFCCEPDLCLAGGFHITTTGHCTISSSSTGVLSPSRKSASTRTSWPTAKTCSAILSKLSSLWLNMARWAPQPIN
jgi:hypothetical protein